MTIIYTLKGDIVTVEDGKNTFQKMTESRVELDICKTLMANPHRNIVEIYNVGPNYVTMENLNTHADFENVREIMHPVKEHLQNLGIVYIDWKCDNMGLSFDGALKLFDFDVSGVIDIHEPRQFYSYNQAVKNGKTSLVDIDDYAFTML
jgi:serine/threonine protein kinase